MTNGQKLIKLINERVCIFVAKHFTNYAKHFIGDENLNRLSEVFFDKKKEKKRVLPDFCVKCHTELCPLDYEYLCDDCWKREYEKQRRLQMA